MTGEQLAAALNDFVQYGWVCFDGKKDAEEFLGALPLSLSSKVTVVEGFGGKWWIEKLRTTGDGVDGGS